MFGHYLELGRTSEPEDPEPVPEGTEFPLQLYVEPIGFRVIGDGCDIATDAKAD